MIWGLALKPGTSCTRVFSEEVHLSLAAMESREEFGKIWPGSYSQVMMKTEDVELLLCTLVHGSIFQQNLDLKLMPNEMITFTAHGDCMIYISGYTNYIPHSGEESHDLQETSDRFEISEYQELAQGNLTSGTTEVQSASWVTDTGENSSHISTDHISAQNLPEAEDVTTITVKEEDLSQDVTYNQSVINGPPSSEAQSGCGSRDADTLVQENFTVVAEPVESDLESFDGRIQKDEQAYHLPPDESPPERSPCSQKGKVRDRQMAPTFRNQSWSIRQASNRKSAAPSRDPRPVGISRAVGERQNTSNWVDLHRTKQTLGSADNSLTQNDGVYSVARSMPLEEAAYSMIDTNSDNATKSLLYTSRPSSSTARIASSEMNSLPKGRGKRCYPQQKAKPAHKRRMAHCCGICNRSFFHQSSLVRHERIHTGVKPYPCRICWKPFADVGNRTKHERIHSRIKLK